MSDLLGDKAVHAVIVYRDTVNSDKIREIDMSIKQKAIMRRNLRIIIHVFSNKDNPLYFEELRDIVLNNISLTLAIMHYNLSVSEFKKLLEKLPREDTIVFIQKNLPEFVEKTQLLGYEPHIF
ncbi:MAG: hypothetical protein ABWW65_06835 [Thermoprotei archaeon]